MEHARREQRPEIGVGRHDDALLRTRTVEDLCVRGTLQSVLADMHGIVSRTGEAVRHERRQGVIDQEFQPAARGSSRSLTASAAY